MQYYFIKLLETLDNSESDSLTVGELREKISNDIDETIRGAVDEKLIIYPNFKSDGGTLGNGERVYLNSKGFEFLNQIRMKEAIEKFNKSSDNTANVLIMLTLLLVYLTWIPTLESQQKNLTTAFSLIILVPLFFYLIFPKMKKFLSHL